MNQLLTRAVRRRDRACRGGSDWHSSSITMLSEGALLFVAAQAGFIDGPRVLANMAHDSYVPHWFGSLSERLAAHNGILLIGGAALAALWATGGKRLDAARHVLDQRVPDVLAVDDRHGLALVAAARQGQALAAAVRPVRVRRRDVPVDSGRHDLLQVSSEGRLAAPCVVTGLFAGTCFLIHRYYRSVTAEAQGPRRIAGHDRGHRASRTWRRPIPTSTRR